MKKVFLTLTVAITLLSSISFGQEKAVRIEAEDFTEKSELVTVKAGDNGKIVSTFSKKSFLKFDKIDFGKGTEQIRFRAGSGSDNKPQLEIRLGDEKGKLLGTLSVENTGWTKLKEYTLDIPKTSGKQKITIISTNGGVILNWFELL